MRVRGVYPDASTTYSTSELLTMMDEEVRTYVWPLLHEVNGDFHVRRHDVSVTAGTATYRLPKRIVGEALKAVIRVLADGSMVPINRIALADSSSGIDGFWFEDDQIVLTPTPTQAFTMRLFYYLRPNKIVDSANAAEIATINGARTVVTLTSGASFTIAATTYDIIRGVPGVRVLEMDKTVSSTSPITFSAALASDVAVGDYLCAPGSTPIPNIPVECFPLLVQRMVCVISKGKPYHDAELRELDRMEARIRSLLQPRAASNPEYVQNFAAPGWGGWRRRWWGGVP